jgi:hypothetical protein
MVSQKEILMARRYAMPTNYHYLILGHRLSASYNPAMHLGDGTMSGYVLTGD